MNMNLNIKTLLVVLFAVLAGASVPLLTSAQPDNATVLGAITGLAMQISSVEDNIMLHLASIDQRLSTLETSTSSSVQSGVNTVTPLLYATIGLVAVALLLGIVNIYLILQRTTAPAKPEKPKEKS